MFAQLKANELPGECPGGVGLTTALAVLPHGWVVVGSLPTTDGTAATAQAGCLIVLDSNGERGLFGLTLAPKSSGVLFVNDSNNTLGLLH